MLAVICGTSVEVIYLDSVPVCSSLLMLQSGLVFCASESGDSYLLQCSPAKLRALTVSDLVPTRNLELAHFKLISTVESMAPLIDGRVMVDAQGGTPSLALVCGSGSRSSLKIMRQGLQMTNLVQYPMPGTATGIWSVSKVVGEHNAFIVISFVNATLVLSISDGGVEEVSAEESGFDTEGVTLHLS